MLLGLPPCCPIGFPGADEEELGSGIGHGLGERMLISAGALSRLEGLAS